MVKGKRYTDAVVRFDQEHQHSAHEALELVKGFSGAKFDESIDVAIRLGVDPRKPEEMIRGTVALPSGTGKDVRIAVFAQGAAVMPAPTTSAVTNSLPRSRAACSTSTWPSPRPT